MTDEEIEQRIAAKCAEIHAEVEARFGPDAPPAAYVEVLTVLVAGLLVQSDLETERSDEKLQRLREMRDRLRSVGR